MMTTTHFAKPCTLWRTALGALCLSVALSGALFTASQAQTLTAKSKPVASQPGSPHQLKWEELVPADWDPMKGFRDKNVGLLDDKDPKTAQLLKDMRDVWDNAPTVPALNGQTVRLPGYLVPLDEVKGELKEFLLVPYFGACVHSPPPPANQIVHVQLSHSAKGYRTMDTVWVQGTLKTARGSTDMGASGYRLDAAQVERYVAK